MTTPSHRIHMREHVLSRRQARRMSRRFAGVGVGVLPARLQQIAAGAPVGDDEYADVNFALAATQIIREEHLARVERNHRRIIRWLIVAGMILVMLNVLLCMAYAMLSLAQNAVP